MSASLSDKLKAHKDSPEYQSKTLGGKLALIGRCYQEAYSNSFRLFHSNHRQAKLLRQLEHATNEHAFLSVIALLRTLPRDGKLSMSLIECISLQNVKALGLHDIPVQLLQPGRGTRPKGHNPGCYYYGIRQFRIREGYANNDIADTLQQFHDKFAIKTSISLQHQVDTQLGQALAALGQAYKQQYPNPPRFFQIWNRHKYQKQASILQQLEKAGRGEAIERCAEVLLSIKKGRLYQSIVELLAKPEYVDAKNKIQDYLTMPTRKPYTGSSL